MNKPIKSRLATIFFLLIGMSTFLIAQEGSVSGRVTDSDTGDPLVGANVIVVGTNLGAATDVNGEYSISRVPAGAHRLNANYIGYASKSMNADIPTNGNAIGDFNLTVAALNLNEVVVTGAGIALDAQSRGLSVCLIEKQDFAQGTSSRSTKLIHGGLRYLKQFNLRAEDKLIGLSIRKGNN